MSFIKSIQYEWFMFMRWVRATRLYYHVNLIPTRIKLAKDRTYDGDDEFHHSLNMDLTALLKMNEKDTEKYMNDLCRRRNLAHIKDMEDDSSRNKETR